MLPHGRFHTLGLVFIERSTQKKFAYYTDCNDLTQEALDFARGADLLALDALRFKPHKSHMTVQQAVDAAQEIRARQTRFVHMTVQVDVERDSEVLPSGVEFAHDGLRIEL